MIARSLSRATRREFLRDALAGGAALAAPWIIRASALGAADRPAASDRITVGCIGLGGRGTVNLNTFLGRADVQLIALCNVDAGSTRYEDAWHRGLAPAVAQVEQRYAAEKVSGTFRGVSGYRDFRELLARDDLDAVCVSTPDHWHGPIVVAAARAGKDIYCEKPLSLTVRDGRAMADAVKRYDRVFQCGSQRRSDARCRHSCELVRNGRIGRLHTVRVGLPGGHWIRSNAQKTFDPEPIPDGFDYDLWLGPAPWAPYYVQPLPLELALEPRLLRRQRHRLGRTHDRHGPLGHGLRRVGADRSRGQRHVPARRGAVERGYRLRVHVHVRQWRQDDRQQRRARTGLREPTAGWNWRARRIRRN